MNMHQETLYADNLIFISDRTIVFTHYYYPTRKSKVIQMADIDHIRVKAPTFWNGKWRIFGTGSLSIWFPEDVNRPRRDRIFFAVLKTQRVKIGFTVEDADRVEAIFREKHLIRE